MRRLFNILVFMALSVSAFAQIDTRIVDSLLEVYATQEGREKVKTMIELTWDFYDISFDESISWGEKALEEANALGYSDLEAKANYVIGIQYAYNADFDLAKQYLLEAYSEFVALNDTKNAFESLWNIATYELTMGSIDTAYRVYEEALLLAELMNDTSACAYITTNMGLVEYQRNQPEKAFRLYDKASRMFQSIGDERMSLRTEYNMAIICSERGQPAEARKRCKRIIPELERFGDYYALFSLCKNLGKIYIDDFINYDTALYYLQKAMDYGEMPMLTKESGLLVKKERSEAVALMGDVMVRKGELKEAIAKYEEALRIGEKNAYPNGQMEACIGLGKVYAQMGQAAKSLQYFRRFEELEKASGTTMMRPAVRKALLMDYARLGMFDELEKELSDFEEDYSALIRENADIYDQNRIMLDEASGLLQQYEAQGDELLKQRKLSRHYKLAFFGVLALALSGLALGAAWVLLRKKSTKKEAKNANA